MDLRNKYELHTLTETDILKRAREKGCWSVWFTVFRGCDELRKTLIDGFEGTCAQCFDPANKYDPIPRNIGEADYV